MFCDYAGGDGSHEVSWEYFREDNHGKGGNHKGAGSSGGVPERTGGEGMSAAHMRKKKYHHDGGLSGSDLYPGDGFGRLSF